MPGGMVKVMSVGVARTSVAGIPPTVTTAPGRKPMPEEILEVKERMLNLDPEAMDVIEADLRGKDKKVKSFTAWEIYRYNHGKPKESMALEGGIEIGFADKVLAVLRKANRTDAAE